MYMNEAMLLMIASIVHAVLKTDEIYVNISALIELKLQRLDKRLHFIVREKEGFIEDVNERGVQALTEILPSDAVSSIVVRSDVYERACRGDPRDRMTLAHECAHYILHGILKIPVKELVKGERRSKYEDPEVLADILGRFLLSLCGLTANMSTAELSFRCGLSEADTVSVQKQYKEGVKKSVRFISAPLNSKVGEPYDMYCTVFHSKQQENL